MFGINIKQIIFTPLKDVLKGVWNRKKQSYS